MVQHNCLYCGFPLKGKRKGSLYCDDKCRMRYARGGGKKPEKETVIQQEEQVKTAEEIYSAKCQGCCKNIKTGFAIECLDPDNKPFCLSLLCVSCVKVFDRNINVKGITFKTYKIEDKWDEAVEAWREGDRAFWPSETEYPDFIPNWVKKGFKSKEQVLEHVIDTLKGAKEKILSRGLGDEPEVVINVGDKQTILKEDKKRGKK